MTARTRQGTFHVPDSNPETTEPQQGVFCVPDSDPETTKSEPEYKDAEERPRKARMHISSSSPKPEQVGQPLVK